MMTVRHIIAPVFSLEEDELALTTAAMVMAKFRAKATALLVEIPPGSEYAEETASLSEVLVHLTQGKHTERERLCAWLQQSGHAFATSSLSVHAAITDRQALALTQLTDLVVMARGVSCRRAHRLMLEQVLFHSGRPTLLATSGSSYNAIGERIAIGWKSRREAVRAANDALPFLKTAKEVSIITVDAAGRAEDLAVHLARHEVVANIRDVSSKGRTEGRALLDEAVALRADMIVMGAYGRSPTQEMLFGGVTRELLADAPLALFLAH